MSFMNRLSFLGRWRFHGADLEESTDYLPNPSCGWYRMFPFELDKEPDFDDLFWCLREKETLVQAVILIGAYREERLPMEALDRLDRIFDFFRTNQKEMILRVAYDGIGQGLLAEPSKLQTVMLHMQQVGPLISRYENDILAFQGLFVGSWGELHDSRYLSRDKLRLLEQSLRSAIGERIPIAVRTPLQWRMLHKLNANPGRDKLCMFNDGLFGSESDLGTYGLKEREKADWLESWERRDELLFIEKMHEKLPYGGEAIGVAKEGELALAVQDMRRTHLCYLNAEHDQKCLDRWKAAAWEEKGLWKDVNGLDYIGAHLGYRPVIRKVTGYADEGLHLELTLVNEGFSYLLEEAQLLISVQAEENNERVQAVSIEPKELAPGGILKVACQFANETTDGEYSVYAKMRRKRDGRMIQIANRQEKGLVLLGTWTSLV